MSVIGPMLGAGGTTKSTSTQPSAGVVPSIIGGIAGLGSMFTGLGPMGLGLTGAATGAATAASNPYLFATPFGH